MFIEIPSYRSLDDLASAALELSLELVPAPQEQTRKEMYEKTMGTPYEEQEWLN